MGLRFLINGEEITVREGEVLHIPSWVPHQAEAIDDTFEMDIFSPIRQDWLDGTDNYFHKRSERDGGGWGGGNHDRPARSGVRCGPLLFTTGCCDCASA